MSLTSKFCPPFEVAYDGGKYVVFDGDGDVYCVVWAGDCSQKPHRRERAYLICDLLNRHGGEAG